VFDKTGTLTKGNFAIKKIYNETNGDILKLAYIAEEASNHPIAISIKNRYLESNKVENFGYSLENIVGKGIKATKSKDTILAGNLKLLQTFHVYAKEVTDPGTIVYVAHNGNYIGYILIEDEIKEDAKETVAYLNSIGSRTIMLTGDNEKIASNVAKEIGLSEFKSNLLPQNKVEEVDNLLKDKKENELLSFVGDGINDAPVIMKSDIGISMGGVGSDAAIEASDIVLMHDDLKSIITAKKVARKTMRIVYENIIFALCIKVLILILAAFGVANMWLSVFGDVGVAIIAILNAMRANSKKY
jgi:Cd2+/Zn2+-exporting ATPase